MRPARPYGPSGALLVHGDTLTSPESVHYARADLAPGTVTDDQGNEYFVDLESLVNLGTSVSNDNGNNWRKNPAAVENTAVDRQWYAVDNRTTSAASDNTIFLSFHETEVGTFIYSSPGSTGATDPVGGLVWQNSSANSPLPLAGDATCAQIRFDSLYRNLYMACNEGNHVRMTIGHVASGQRTGIVYHNIALPVSPGGGGPGHLFPALAIDRGGNVYAAWIDTQDNNVYYSYSTDQGQSWVTPVQVNSWPSVTNEFIWAQGYMGVITGATSTRATIGQQRFTEKPMYYGQICNQGIGCTVSGGDRTMADFFGFASDRSGGMRIVYNDVTSQHHGAHLFEIRQIGGRSIFGGNVRGTVVGNPASDPTGDAQWPHYSPTGAGANQPNMDFTGVQVGQPSAGTLRVRMSLGNLSSFAPPLGKTNAFWLTRFQALSTGDSGEETYRIFYVGAQSTGGLTPSFFVGTPTCTDSTPGTCKVVNYPVQNMITGHVCGNTLVADVPPSVFGAPVSGPLLYNVTALSGGRNADVDLYADVDATPSFDYVLGSATGGASC